MLRFFAIFWVLVQLWLQFLFIDESLDLMRCRLNICILALGSYSLRALLTLLFCMQLLSSFLRFCLLRYSIKQYVLERRLGHETEWAERERFRQARFHASNFFIEYFTLLHSFALTRFSIQLLIILNLPPVAVARFKTYIWGCRAFFLLGFLAVKFLHLFQALDLLCFHLGSKLGQSLLRGFPAGWNFLNALIRNFANF